MKSWHKLFIMTLLAGGLALLAAPNPVQAQTQWPPFIFRLTPAYQDGRISYDLFFASRADGELTDVSIHIPLPAGTRFVEAQAQPSTEVSFDGQELKFFTSVLHRDSIRVASFLVEPTAPEQTVFATQAWLAWKGDLPGDYLTDEVSLDITKSPLEWARPVRSRLQLEVAAAAANNVLTYFIYPTNVGGRMWDATVKLPLPEETTFLSAEASHPFVADFDGQEVTFFASELERGSQAGPLQVQVSTENVTAPGLVTHAWATWKNVGGAVGRTIPLQEDTRTGDIIVQPHAAQWVLVDAMGDVPFATYDVTSITLGAEAEALAITFYTTGELEPVGRPFTFIFNIDNCAGQAKYQVAYNRENGRATIRFWNIDTGKWDPTRPVEVTNPGPRQITIRIPYDLFEDSQHGRDFCGRATVQDRTDAFSSRPPNEIVPNIDNPLLTHYQAMTVTTAVTPTSTSPGNTPANIPPDRTGANFQSPVETVTALSGQLAVPIDNGRGTYDVHIFALPDGQEVANIPNARQPDFRFDGQRLLVNREGDGQENVYEIDLDGQVERQVSGASGDSWPVYDPWGNRVAYGNAELVPGVPTNNQFANNSGGNITNGDDGRKPFIFIQCSLLPPHLETEPRCQDIAGQGMLIPAGQMGEIVGTHPVWTASDMIAYHGCDTWAGSGTCGIYLAPSASTRGFSDGLIPGQLTRDPDDMPADAWGNLIAFTARRDGNWEAYVMHLDGSGAKNLSNSPFNDGLPTISPDGQWVAFVSDRGGRWAVWVTPLAGGEVTKLFDLPVDIPWGDGDRAWLNERLSWGGSGADRPAVAAPVPTPDYFQLYPATPPATTEP